MTDPTSAMDEIPLVPLPPPLHAVVDLPDCHIYQGRADEWACDRRVDLVFTNPYDPLPPCLRTAKKLPMILHQWVHRKHELEDWIGLHAAGWDGDRFLQLIGLWNNGREAFWSVNLPYFEVDLSEFRPEPGGWYPPEMVLRILRAYPRPLYADSDFRVWDGFMGRGTVGQIVRALGLTYIGIEELPAHIALARQYLGV